jgi:thymidylate synthase
MKQYLDMAADALAGKRRGDRTKVGTVGKFGYQMRFDLTEGYPLVTTKKVFTRGIFDELKWFVLGLTNAKWLQDRGVKIWDDWALTEPIVVMQDKTSDELYNSVAEKLGISYGEAVNKFADQPNPYTTEVWLEEIGVSRKKEVVKYGVGECGPIYGKQFRRALAVSPDGEVITVDQLKKVIHDLKIRPYSRRHLVSAWSLGELPDESISPLENVKQGRQSLAACHSFFQFYVEDMDAEEALSRSLARAEYDMNSIVTESELLACETVEILDRGLAFKKKLTELGVLSEEEEAQRQKDERRLEVIQPRLERLNSLAHNQETYIARLKSGDEVTISNLPNKRLSCQLYQRSADIPLGVPFNIASYAALTHLMAEMVGMMPGDFIHLFGDYHVYTNQVELMQEQLTREPLRLPSLRIEGIPPMTEEQWREDPFQFIDQVNFDVIGYVSHAAIKFPDPAV